METVSVAVPAAFVAYVEAALVRLSYLYPDVAWSFEGAGSNLSGAYKGNAHSGETLVKEATFQLYREKIAQDTLEIRRKIYGAI